MRSLTHFVRSANSIRWWFFQRKMSVASLYEIVVFFSFWEWPLVRLLESNLKTFEIDVRQSIEHFVHFSKIYLEHIDRRRRGKTRSQEDRAWFWRGLDQTRWTRTSWGLNTRSRGGTARRRNSPDDRSSCWHSGRSACVRTPLTRLWSSLVASTAP